MMSLQAALTDWEAVIGLEVHVELTTLNTKMFCSCAVEFGGAPNTRVCPVCLGLPGALPVPNQAAIESIVMAGLATGCDIEKRSMFYRKNYFYPDMSKNFQTTQGPVAFCMRGSVPLDVIGERAALRHDRSGTEALPAAWGVEGYRTLIGITRIHMEEDAGKMILVGGADGRISGADYSLVDYNRCGTPLIELVTEPDLRTPEEARLFLQKLRQIYLALGISDCSMEEGSLRCDGNVSLRRRGDDAFGVKTELKNMNSFKNLHDGLAYEICRQAEVLEGGGAVLQETRHWEPTAKRTISMRVKETADDYRLFPEPDLAPYDLSEQFIDSVRARLPELPDSKRQRYMSEHRLSYNDAVTISVDPGLSAFFDAACSSVRDLCPDAGSQDIDAIAKTAANLLINEVSAHMNSTGISLAESKLAPEALAQLSQLANGGAISSRQARDVLALMLESGRMPQEIIEAEGMEQINDSAAIEQLARGVLEQHPDKVEQYRNGKTGLIGFFTGAMMKATGGQGNPKLINEVLSRLLAE
jgi:aspartyl-tRNA(Asn)/glutamyl-tRNA(Gln) amidotransferase subunit B